MNLAQAVISHGDGTYSWLEVSPGRWCLASQLEHAQPRKYRSKYRRTGRMFDIHSPWNKEISERLISALERARRSGVRLTFGELFERLGIEQRSYRRSLRILIWMCGEGRVCRAGKYRSAVYWAPR